MRKYSKIETPSLGRGQTWEPKSGPGPYREHIGAGAAFPPLRNVDAERATRWFDPTKGAKSAKSKNASPRGRRK
jgi:hypothetical protein